MSDGLQVTILGCGASAGVPLIGCECSVCCSPNPKDKRTRSSILIEQGGTRLLVDTSPDLRQQALRQGISQVDAILYTHDHADHTHGIDDARSFNFHRKAGLPVYGTGETMKSISGRFDYAFGAPAKPGGVWLKPSLQVQEIDEYDDFTVGNIHILSFLQHHGKGKSIGYRIGNFAYSTDVDNIPEKSLQLLEKLDVWVVDCLRRTPSATHASLEIALGWIAQLKPRLSILTHMGHELGYDELLAELPPHIIPAYDGLLLHLPSDSHGRFC